jgi:hypothetical protein
VWMAMCGRILSLRHSPKNALTSLCTQVKTLR